MIEPKFKHLQIVKSKHCEPFAITQIRYGLNVFWYNSNATTMDWQPEEFLELHQEPVKKKLYAFISKEQEVGFKTKDKWNDGDTLGDYFWIRAPEYDIVFDEAK